MNMTNNDHWTTRSIFYHIYPLGLCGAPAHNDFASPPVHRLARLHDWLDHITGLGANAVYLGPLFESSRHGYDTADYFTLDRRLGDNRTLKNLLADMKGRGMRVILDAVFNHVGRDFWAFKDLQAHGEGSAYKDWFHGIDFSQRSPKGDPFSYEGWAGHYSLVKLNLHNPAVRQHLFAAVDDWVREFDIDGLRMDAADVMDRDFLAALAAHGRSLKPDFWLVGEMVHGDYHAIAGNGRLDAVTNYEAYKGLWSSLVDANYHEIAYALRRQSGEGGIYRDLGLYNFVDNHDVNRVASNLRRSSHLYPLYLMLLTMPGVPSIYYGSEWGIEGRRERHTDRGLRPALDLARVGEWAPQPDLPRAIGQLAHLRQALPALQTGDYTELMVDSQQMAFSRSVDGQRVVVALNAAGEKARLKLKNLPGRELVDRLNGDERLPVVNGVAEVPVDAHWGRVMVLA